MWNASEQEWCDSVLGTITTENTTVWEICNEYKGNICNDNPAYVHRVNATHEGQWKVTGVQSAALSIKKHGGSQK